MFAASRGVLLPKNGQGVSDAPSRITNIPFILILRERNL